MQFHILILFVIALLLCVLLNFNVVLRVVVKIFVKELLCGTIVVTARFEIRRTQDGFRQVGEPRRHRLEVAFSSKILKSQLVSWGVQNTAALVFG